MIKYGHHLKANYTLWLLLLFLCLIISSLIILASVPPVSRDALIHHLAIPKLYLKNGSIYEIPELIFSYYPMNLDLLYMGALYIGNDVLPKYIHMVFGIATAVLIIFYLKERLSINYGLIGGLFFLSIPIIIKLAITAYVDLGLVFFSTASLLLLFKWIDTKHSKKYIIFSGLCCGLAIGTKYNGLIILFLFTLFIPILYLRTSNEKNNFPAILTTTIFLCCAVLSSSPWLIRNFAWTGNPIFPLYDSFFNPFASVIGSTLSSDSMPSSVFSTRYLLFGERLLDILILPVRIFFEGIDDNPQYFDGQLNPFLLILSVFSFLSPQQSTQKIKLEKITLLFFSMLFFLFAVHMSVLRIRYLSPIIPPLVILSVYGLYNIQTYLNKFLTYSFILKVITMLLIVTTFLPNFLYIRKQFLTVKPLEYLNNSISKKEYINIYRPEYTVMDYANNTLPSSTRILCIFLGWRGYYLDRPHHFDHYNNPNWLIAWFTEDEITSDDLAKRFSTHNISHLMIREDIFSQWLKMQDPNKKSVWENFSKIYLTPLVINGTYILFEIKSG